MSEDPPTAAIYLLGQGLAYAWPNIIQTALLFAAAIALLRVLLAPPAATEESL